MASKKPSPRYQVLFDKEIHNFHSKKEALKFRDEMKAKGKDTTFWDTLDNCISNKFFSILGRGSKK